MRNLVIFTAGLVIGALGTWKFVEEKYRKISNEEIESVRQMYEEREKAKEKVNEAIKEASDISKEVLDKINNKPDIQEYTNIVKTYESNNNKKDATEEPYVIDPEEFGDIDGYETSTLLYFEGDGYLTDDNHELIDNMDEIIGFDALNHFGDYEDDAVHIRNDNLQTDYEILKCLGNYKDL